MRNILLLLLIILSSAVVQGSRILGVFPYPSLSHLKVFNAISKALYFKGHEIFIVTPNPTETKLKNFTEVNVSVTYNIFDQIDITNTRREVNSVIKIFDIFAKSNELALELTMATEGVRELMKKPEDYFDLILVEAHFPSVYCFQPKFKAPLVAVSSLGISAGMENFFGNPIHPILYPTLFASVSSYPSEAMSISDKIDSVYATLCDWFYLYWILIPRSDVVGRKLFGSDMPYISDIIKNTSLLFLNVNPVLSTRKPCAPNIIYFHNIHQKYGKDPMSVDLQQILDNAKNGVVYFSLGTNVRFDHVEKDFKNTVLRTLGELPYTVLCKWESEDYPGKPKNVVLRKWFPQQSVLAHPNIKVFVTQGGLQSSEEAIINAVPLVIIPFLGDQPMNARILTSHGMAETIQPNKLTQEDLKETIMKVATEEKYHTRAKELREIFLDQPQSGLDKIVWWCEYVIRHKGAKHLRSPGADIPLYEYFMLDLLAVFIAALLVFYMVVKQLFKLMKYSFQYIKQKKD